MRRQTIEDIVDDIVRDNYGDQEVDHNFELLRQSRLMKGLPHIEVLRSKTFNTLKYLLKEEPSGDLTISDLDTGAEFYMNLGPLKTRIRKDSFSKAA